MGVVMYINGFLHEKRRNAVEERIFQKDCTARRRRVLATIARRLKRDKRKAIKLGEEWDEDEDYFTDYVKMVVKVELN